MARNTSVTRPVGTSEQGPGSDCHQHVQVVFGVNSKAFSESGPSATLVSNVSSTLTVYLRDGSAETIGGAATLKEKP